MKHFRFYPHLVALFALGFALPAPLAAQNYIDQFDAALQSRDLVLQQKILAEWQAAGPDDRDYYIARYNYYLHRDTLLATPDSALAVLDTAIVRLPDQLDLRFGKVYHLAMKEQWDAFADELVALLDHSERIHHKWQFGYFSGGGEEFVVSGVQDCLEALFQQIPDPDHLTAADSVMVLRLRRVAKRLAQVFPEDVPALNFLAVSYTLVGDYPKALRYLRRAQAIDPTDPVIRQNIADLEGR